jgi:hypothetical protein
MYGFHKGSHRPVRGQNGISAYLILKYRIRNL